MKTIKIIDLLGLMLERKAPKTIKFLGMTMRFVENAEWGDYLEINGCQMLSKCRIIDCLNDYVGIIEETEKPKKIEHIKKNQNRNDKINEIIDSVNYLLEKNDKDE